MASFDDVRRIALSLPETTEAVSWGNAHWRVKNKGFVWERPLNQSDYAALEALGEPAPEGALLGVRIADIGVREAMIADDPNLFSTIPHFDDFPAILVRLVEMVDAGRLRVPIAATYPLAQAAAAQTALKQRRPPGKIVLVV